jgi:hypothetical protein
MTEQLVKRVVVEVCLDNQVIVIMRLQEVLALAS